MNDIFKETFGGVKKSVATALVDVKDFRIPLPNIKANLSFFNFNDEDTKRLEEKKKELKEIELAQSSLSVKRICVGISGELKTDTRTGCRRRVSSFS
ncbi:hypothetical protein AX774_g5810 [Zancudomyces culisetae]|uniref:Uncharacterized protein n=1 Tax=Zancudomyces culisetae TaxID=1213189 RepID=A0A1R1PIG9_ZANCU|nr:hypothetical protein AX774_g5810 [Zancudomyces culisetae]|eukprot:OMH80746.1 hypothetical protein AX774_g5810 [Zancudomyces culisetae]